MQRNFFCCPNKTFCLSNQNLIDVAKCFVDIAKFCFGTDLRLLLLFLKTHLLFYMFSICFLFYSFFLHVQSPLSIFTLVYLPVRYECRYVLSPCLLYDIIYTWLNFATFFLKRKLISTAPFVRRKDNNHKQLKLIKNVHFIVSFFILKNCLLRGSITFESPKIVSFLWFIFRAYPNKFFFWGHLWQEI